MDYRNYTNPSIREFLVTNNQNKKVGIVKIKGAKKLGKSSKTKKHDQIIRKIAQKELQGTETSVSISISKVKKDKVIYTVGQDHHEKSLDLSGSQNKDWTLSELGGDLPVQGARVALKSKGFRNLHREIVQSWPEDRPKVGFLFKFFIAPFLALNHTLRPENSTVAKKRLNELLQAESPKNEKEFRTLVKYQLDVLRSVEPEDSPMLLQLEQLVVNSEKIEAAFQNRDLHQTCRSLLEDFSQSEQTELVFSSGVPSHLGVYQPLVFTLKKEGVNFQLHLLHLGSEPAPFLKESAWDLQQTNTEELSQLLSGLLAAGSSYSEEEKSNPLLHQAGRIVLDEKKIQARKIQKKDSKSTDKKHPSSGVKPPEYTLLTPLKKLEEQIQRMGGKEVKGSRLESKSKKDSWDLMHRLMHDPSQDTSSPVQRYIYSLNILSRQIGTYEKALKKLPPHQRQEVGKNLLERLSILRQRTKKDLPNEPNLQAQVQGSLDHLSAKVREMTGLQTVKVGKESFVDPSVLQSLSETSEAKTFEPNVIQLHLKQLDQLSLAIQNNQVDTALENYTSLASALDSLVEEGKYEQALILAEAVQHRLPVPRAFSAGSQNFWLQMKADHPASWDQIKQWEEQLDKVTSCQWEASTRMGRSYMSNREMLGILNGRAIYQALADRKIAVVTKNENPTKQDCQSLGVTSLKSQGASYEQAACLAFRNFKIDSAQALDILNYHPYYRFGQTRESSQKAQELSNYLSELQNDSDRAILRLDSRIDNPQSEQTQTSRLDETVYDHSKIYFKEADQKYLSILGLTRATYDMKTPEGWPLDIDLIPEKGQHLPPEIIHLRRHYAMAQMMYRPEFSTALSFGKGTSGMLRALNWWEGVQAQATQDCLENLDQMEDRMVEIAFEQLDEEISHMKGRLQLSIGSHTDEPCIAVKGSKGKAIVNYLPWGYGLNEELKSRFSPKPKDTQAKGLVGNLPEKWTCSPVGFQDQRLEHASSRSRFTKRENSKDTAPVQEKIGYTELGHLTLSMMEEPDIGVVEDYLLSTLLISNHGGGGYLNFQDSGFIEGMHLICSRPALLSRPEVRTRIDLLFSQQGHIKNISKYHPEALKTLSPILQGQVEKQLLMGEFEVAGFLMRIGNLFSSQGPSSLPGYKSDYFANHPSKAIVSGLEALKAGGAAAEEAFTICFLEHLQNAFSDRGALQQAIAQKEIAPQDLFQALSKIDLLSDDQLPPYKRFQAQSWAREVGFPELSIYAQRTPVFLDQLANSPPSTREGWDKVDGNDLVYRQGNRQVNLETGEVQIDGQASLQNPLTTTLPRSLFKSFPQLSSFLSPKLPVQKMRGESSGEWIYSFQSGGMDYRIVESTRTGQIQLFRNHKKELFASPSSSSTGPAGLAQELGLWIDLEDPTKATIDLSSLPSSAIMGSIHIQLSDRGHLQKITDPSGRELQELPPQLHQNTFPFASPQTTLYLPAKEGEPEKVILLDKGLIFEKDGKNWKEKKAFLSTSIQLTDYSSPGEKIFHLLPEGVGMHLGNKVDEERLLLYPRKITIKHGAAFVNPEATLKGELETPLAEIKIGADGTIQGSAGAYLYLSYALMKQGHHTEARKMLAFAAEKGQMPGEQNKKLFTSVAALIRNEHPGTTRRLAWQLEAEHSLLQMEQQQLGKFGYDPLLSSEYMGRVQHLNQLKQRFENSQKRSLGKQKFTQGDQSVYEISQGTLEHLQSLSKEAFGELLTQGQNEARIGVGRTFAPVILASITPGFVGSLAQKMRLPKEGEPPIDLAVLKSPSLFDAEHILYHFHDYYDGIMHGELGINDLQHLYNSIPGEDQRPPPLDVRHADLARRLLLQTAILNSQGAFKPDVKDQDSQSQKSVVILEEPPKPLSPTQAEEARSRVPQKKGKTTKKKILLDFLKNPKKWTEDAEEAVLEMAVSRDAEKVASFVMDELFVPIQAFENLNLPTDAPEGELSTYRIGAQGFVTTEQLKKQKHLREGEIDVQSALKNFDQIKQQLSLSSTESVLLKNALETAKEDNIQSIFLDNLLAYLDTSHTTSSIEKRREQNLRLTIQGLEQRIIKQSGPPPKNWDSAQLGGIPNYQVDLDTYFEKQDTGNSSPQAKLDKVSDQVKLSFGKAKNAARREEDNQVCKGVDEVVAKRLEPKIDFDREFKADQLSNLLTALEKDIDKNPNASNGAFDLYKNQEQKLLRLSKETFSELSELKHLKKINPFPSDQDRLNALLDAYQRGEPSLKSHKEDITSYLLYGTAVQQLKNAKQTAENLQRIQNKLKQAKAGSETDLLKAQEKEESRKLAEILDRNLNTKRYLDKTTNKLKDPKLYRKILVSEFRLGIILRPSQIEKITAIAENPEDWYTLRMGEGKTFIIMPIIASLLSDEGILPVMMVPPQLESINREDFDRTTLKAFGIRGEPFRADLDRTHSAAYLAGLYEQALNTRLRQGYLVSSVPTLASLRSLTTQLREERRDLRSQLREKAQAQHLSLVELIEDSEDPEVLQLLSQVRDVESRLHWARKLERFLDGKIEHIDDQGRKQIKDADTLLFADEADALYHISKEINRGLGSPISVSPEIRDITKSIFHTLLHRPLSKEADQTLNAPEKEALKELRSALLQGTQSTLDPSSLKRKYLSPLLKATLADSEVAKNLPPEVQGLIQNPPPQFLEYLLGLTEETPQEVLDFRQKNLTGDLEIQKKQLSSLKQIFSISLKGMLTQEPGTKFKLDEARGGLCVPAELGEENEGNRYGDEFELIAYQYLGHIQAHVTQAKLSPQTQVFYENTLRNLQDLNPLLLSQIKNSIRSKSGKLPAVPSTKDFATELLGNPLLWQERMQLADQALFDGGLVTRFKEQVTVSAQDVISGRKKGGVSGTLSPAALPGFDPKKQTASTRTVEAETYLLAGINHDFGLNTKVASFDDTNPQKTQAFLIGQIKKDDTVALVNEGGYGMEGKNVTTWVESIRGSIPGKNLVWFDRDPERNTKVYLWEAGKESYVETSSEALKKSGQPFVGIYGPAFTRGADLPLPPGKAVFLPGRASNPQDAGQSIWRARGTGDRHTTEICMPQSVTGKETWTMGGVFDWLTDRGLQDQLPTNLSAHRKRIADIAASRVRIFQNGFEEKELSSSYWAMPQGEKDEEGAKQAFEAFTFATFSDGVDELLRGYSIKDKSVDFDANLDPEKEVGTIEGSLLPMYELEIGKAREKKAMLSAVARKGVQQALIDLGIDVPDSPLDSDTVSNLAEAFEFSNPENDPRTSDLYQLGLSEDQENGLLMLQMQLDHILKQHQKGKENQTEKKLRDSFKKIQMKQEEIDLLIPGLLHIVHAYETLSEAEKAINDAKIEFEQDKKEYEKYLPSRTSAKVSSAGTQEQVQQQQQQQQQVSQKNTRKKGQGMIKSLNHRYKYCDLKGLKGFHSLTPKSWGKSDGIFLSPEAQHLREVGIGPGIPGCKFAVKADGRVAVITKLDFYASIEKKSQDAFFAPVGDQLWHLKGPSQATLSPEAKKNIAIAKLNLGMLQFSKEELEDLKSWYNHLNPSEKAEVNKFVERESHMSMTKLLSSAPT